MKILEYLLMSLFVMMSFSVLVSSDALFNSPSVCNGQWTSCNNGFSDNFNYATATVRRNTITGTWKGYGISLPNSTKIDSVVIRADFFSSRTTGFIDVRVSGDNGLTYGAPHRVGGNLNEQSFQINVTNDIAWSPDKLNNSNLIVVATCLNENGSGKVNCELEWIPIIVSYTLLEPSCIRYNPTVSIEPFIQSGSAGTTKTYTTTVTNNDVDSCGSSSFLMVYNIPSGWSGAYGPLTLIAPGGVGMTNLSVTSNINASVGNYTFISIAQNQAAPWKSGNDTAIYEVI